jgi:beta-galactosidase
VLRPGPYCCAEVEYGGIPYWTAKYPDVKIRTNDPKYVEWSRKYIEQVYKQVADLQVNRGGPLLMVQMENEFAMVAGASGGYDYLKSLHGIFKDVGFQVPLFVCDPGSFSGRGGGNPYGDDVLRGRNGLNGEQAYQQALTAAGDFPVYAPEVYTAWFSGWGQPIATRNSTIPAISNWTNFLLDHNASWCYYLFFGGTNWGYNTGCNEWLPLQTSYDYNAPIDEAGRTTEKYRALREILAKRTGRELPAVPPDPAVGTLPPITLSLREPLLAALPATPTRTAAKPLSMEDLDQDYGFVLYRKQFPAGLKGKLELRQVMDYAITMVNGKTIGRSFVGYGPESSAMEVDKSGAVTLDILVHNLGRISVITSSASQSRARKGLIGGATLDGQELGGGDWQMYSLPFKSETSQTVLAKPGSHVGPTFYQGSFNVTQPASTFLDMRNWGMGVVWVNGHNLGRYWDRGGLRSLFLSEHFLHAGANEIVILELHDPPKNPQVSGVTKIVEEPAVPFAMRLDRSVIAPASAPARGR